MQRIYLALFVMLLASNCFSGCSNSIARQVPVYPVDGQLYVDGKPAVGALVTFHPTGGNATPSKEVVVRADGHFVATQPDGAVGLPEGTYSLTATWPESGTDRLAGKYADKASPLAQVTVTSGINLIPPIKLP